MCSGFIPFYFYICCCCCCCFLRVRQLNFNCVWGVGGWVCVRTYMHMHMYMFIGWLTGCLCCCDGYACEKITKLTKKNRKSTLTTECSVQRLSYSQCTIKAATTTTTAATAMPKCSIVYKYETNDTTTTTRYKRKKRHLEKTSGRERVRWKKEANTHTHDERKMGKNNSKCTIKQK